MIKVFCVKSDDSYYRSTDPYEPIPYVNKNDYYYVNDDSFTDNIDIIQVYYLNKGDYRYHGVFYKKCFISLDKRREQRINKILEND